MRNNNKIFFIIGIIFFIGSVLYVSAGITNGIEERQKNNLISEKLVEAGISGMRIVNFSINDVESKTITKEVSEFKLETVYTKDKNSIKQNIFLTNNLGLNKYFNISNLIEIDYNEIIWNGTRYYLINYTKDKPLILSSWKNEYGKLIVPNIFFDDVFNKRINYKDIAEQGGYALAYNYKGISYIELKINKEVKSLVTEKIDPTYINQTDGFSTSKLGSGSPVGITTNGSDFWILSPYNFFVYHSDHNGNNMTDGFSISTLSSQYHFGITTNGSDFWLADLGNYFINHLNKLGQNMTDGFSTTSSMPGYSPQGITTNSSFKKVTDFWITANGIISHTGNTGINKTGGFSPSSFNADNPRGIVSNNTDLWFIEPVDNFLYHTNKLGQNMTDGISLSNFGISNPEGLTKNIDSGSPTDFWITDLTDLFVYHINTLESQCIPVLNQDWIITNNQNCNRKEVNLGIGNIIIQGNGYLSLINSANITTNSLLINATGDRVFINKGSELWIG